MGPDRVCFGSDYPHPEGLDEPLAFAEQLSYLNRDDVRRVMSDNMFDLVGITRPTAAASR
jgi:predicted TIM-barrel fold metal-dependent hydrolase